MSRLYNTVKRYYDMGIYTKDNVATFVRAKQLTEEEYALITGDAYGG